MKIIMKVTAAGPNGNFLAGQTYGVPHPINKEQAADFVNGGYAAVAPEAPVPAAAPTPAAKKDYVPGPEDEKEEGKEAEAGNKHGRKGR